MRTSESTVCGDLGWYSTAVELPTMEPLKGGCYVSTKRLKPGADCVALPSQESLDDITGSRCWCRLKLGNEEALLNSYYRQTNRGFLWRLL
jgi:hypothetical protein